MKKQSNIILITEDNSIEDLMSLRIIPLREMDSLKTVNFKQGFNQDFGRPDVIIIYWNNDASKENECIELIRHLRLKEKLKSTSIIMIIDEYDKEFIIKAYSEYIDDFIIKDSERGSVLLKIMWALKKSGLNKELNKERDFLKALGIVDLKTGFYVADYREKVFNHELNYTESDADNSIMMISASEEHKSNFNYEEVISSLKSSLRVSDVIFHGLNEKIFILFPYTPINTMGIIYKKLAANLTQPESLIAVATDIKGKSFSAIETSLLSNLAKAEFSEEGYLVIEEKPLDNEEGKDESWQEWMNENLGTPKNFKLFKKTYNKKLKTVITPTFYQLQKTYEDKLFEVKVEQVTGNTTSKFILKKENNESELQINYNGFSKINVNIIHNGFDSPENQNYEIDLSEITEEYITKLVEDFIKSFEGCYCK